MGTSQGKRPAAVPEDVDATCVLAFVNTLSARPTDAPVERLLSYDALLDWTREAGLLTQEDIHRLALRARRRSDEGSRVVQQARALRELLHETFTATSARRTPPGATLKRLSSELSLWFPHGRLVPAGDSLQWAYGGGDQLERPLWEVARAASRLLTSPKLARVRACAAADCGWWFLDDTKNASRRWCDMKSCGNREKVRRFRERQRA